MVAFQINYFLMFIVELLLLRVIHSYIYEIAEAQMKHTNYHLLLNK